MKPRTTDNPIAFRTICDLLELETLRAIWKSWPGTLDSDIDFFSSTIRRRGDGCRPHVLLLTCNSRPDAMLVGLRERRKVAFKLGFKLGYLTVYEPEINVLEFVYGGLRGNASEANCTAFVREVMRLLDEGDADIALWEQVEVQSSLYNCALRLPRFAFRDHSHSVIEHWLMNFPKGLEAFFMSLAPRQRSTLRRKYKKVLNRSGGGVQVRCFRSPADLEQAISDIEEIASKTDKRLFGFGFFDTPQIREQLVAEAKNGWLRIYILYLDEKPAAFWMGTLYNHCLHAAHLGYDPVWREFSPGIVLFLRILEDLRSEDIETVDFGWGNTQLNECFGDVQRTESQVHIYAPTLRGIQLSILHTTTHRANVFIRHTRCLEGARKALRGYVVRQRRKQRRVVGCVPRDAAHKQESIVHENEEGRLGTLPSR